MDIAEIEKRVDRAIAAPITVNAEVGGIALENMGQVMEFAKLMASPAPPSRNICAAIPAAASRFVRARCAGRWTRSRSPRKATGGQQGRRAHRVRGAACACRDHRTRSAEEAAALRDHSARVTSGAAKSGARSGARTSRTATPARLWRNYVMRVAATSTARSRARRCGTRCRRSSLHTRPIASGAACSPARRCLASTRRTNSKTARRVDVTPPTRSMPTRRNCGTPRRRVWKRIVDSMQEHVTEMAAGAILDHRGRNQFRSRRTEGRYE